MKPHWPLWTSLMLALLTGPIAADSFPILVYPCPRATAAPRVDGRLDDACWRDAPLVSGFTLLGTRDAAGIQTAFRVVHDDGTLYFGIAADEPLASKLTRAAKGGPDDTSAFGEEHVEVFIDPHHDHNDYYQLVAGLSGTLHDRRGESAGWDSKAVSASHLNKTRWTMELAVPMSELGNSHLRSGMVMGFIVGRKRRAGQRGQTSQWSLRDGGFHDPPSFAHLVLSPGPGAAEAMDRQFRLGGRTGPIRIFNADGFSNVTYLALARSRLEELDRSIAELEALLQRSGSSEAAGRLRLRIAAAGKAAGPIRRKLSAARRIDAAEWVRMDHALKALIQSSSDVVLKARIEALLDSI